MEFIGYDEIYPEEGFPKMADSFESEPYENMFKILRFFKKEHHLGVLTLKSDRDVFTDEVLPTEKATYDDGKYTWFSSLPHYIRNYNLRLPEDFEKHILENWK